MTASLQPYANNINEEYMSSSRKSVLKIKRTYKMDEDMEFYR